MSKTHNVNLKNTRYEFSTKKRILQKKEEKISSIRKEKQIINNYRVPNPTPVRYRISLDRLRLPR